MATPAGLARAWANACSTRSATGPAWACCSSCRPSCGCSPCRSIDVISFLQPMTKGDWALGLLIVPIMMPMLFSFAMTFGYALLFLGHVLVASSLGENDHPRWPEWHPSDISEGIGRWFWAGLFGIALGGGPLVLYWMHRGDMGLLDWVVLIGLIMVGVGYAQMALAASLLHDNIVAANPVTVIRPIARIGWDYLRPCLVAALALVHGRNGVCGPCSTGCRRCGPRASRSGPSGSSSSTRRWS